MRSSTPRATLAAVAISLGLGLGAAACTKAEEPAAPATSISPGSSAQSSDANTVPPGVSGQGSEGGTGQGKSTP